MTDDASGKIHYLAPPRDGDGPPLGKFRSIDFVRLQFKTVPQRDWIVPGYLPIGKVTGLYGPPGDGKSTISQQLLTSTALGRSWLGFSVKPVKSLGVFCEDDEDDLHIRQHEINQHYGCQFDDLEDMQIVSRLGEDNAMITFNGHPKVTDLWHQTMSAAGDFGAELVVIDTMADVFSGNQNDPTQVRQFVQHALGRMARELNAAVLLCAHPSRSGQHSGSGDGGSAQWDATLRSRLYLTRPEVPDGEEPDPDARLLIRKKANFAQRDEVIKLRWQDGVFVRNEPETGIIAAINHQGCETKFLELLDEANRQKRFLSASRNSADFAPKIFLRKAKSARGGFGLRDFERAMEALFDAGELHIETGGPPSRPRSWITRAPLADGGPR